MIGAICVGQIAPAHAEDPTTPTTETTKVVHTKILPDGTIDVTVTITTTTPGTGDPDTKPDTKPKPHKPWTDQTPRELLEGGGKKIWDHIRGKKDPKPETPKPETPKPETPKAD